MYSILIIASVQPEPYEKADDGSCLVTGFRGGPFDGGGKQLTWLFNKSNPPSEANKDAWMISLLH